mmetsp:Transcript_7793/g.13877  ORF Transcript_7793/g.13877 Transcript_7793/m.13877 type:complete len:104 (-) Transcript_7793:1085-1396(-)
MGQQKWSEAQTRDQAQSWQVSRVDNTRSGGDYIRKMWLCDARHVATCKLQPTNTQIVATNQPEMAFTRMLLFAQVQMASELKGRIFPHENSKGLAFLSSWFAA